MLKLIKPNGTLYQAEDFTDEQLYRMTPSLAGFYINRLPLDRQMSFRFFASDSASTRFASSVFISPKTWGKLVNMGDS